MLPSSAILALAAISHAQTSSVANVASGYAVQRVASGLSKPRGIIFDAQDNLLVVQSGVGISQLPFADASGMFAEASTVVGSSDVSLTYEISKMRRLLTVSAQPWHRTLGRW